VLTFAHSRFPTSASPPTPSTSALHSPLQSLCGCDLRAQVLTRTTDVTVRLTELQRFVNVVAGRIKRTLPGALLGASLKLRTNSRWNERTGVPGISSW
jgi:hypothetical protein